MAYFDEFEDYGEDQDPQYPWTFAQYPDLMAARQTEEDPNDELLRWMHEQRLKRKAEEEERTRSASDHSPWESFTDMFTVPNAIRTIGSTGGGIVGGAAGGFFGGGAGAVPGAMIGSAIGGGGADALARWYAGEEQNPWASGVEAASAGLTAPLGLGLPGKAAGAKALWNFAKSQAGVGMLDAAVGANPRKMAEEGVWNKEGNLNMVSPWELLGQTAVGGLTSGVLSGVTGGAHTRYADWKGSPFDVQPPPGFKRGGGLPLEEGMPGREPIFPKLPKETQPANPATTGEGLIPPVRPPEGFSQVQDLPGVADDFSLVANVGTPEAKAVQHPWVAKAMQQVDNPIDYENNIAGQMRRANPRTTDRDIADFIETHPFVPQAETQAPPVFPPTTLDEGRNVAQQALESDVTPPVNLPGQEDIDAAIGRGDRQITDLLNTAPVSSAMHTQAPRQEFEELIREIREARDLKDSLRADPIKANDAFLSRIPPTDPGTLAYLAQQGTITPEEASAIQNYQRAGREQQTRPGFNFATQNQPGGMDPPVAPPIHGDLGGPPVEAPNFDIAGMAERSRQAEARPDTQRGDFQEQLRAGVTENNADLTRLTGVRDAALEEASNIIDPVRKGDAILRYISENVPDGADLDFMRLTGLLDKNQLHAIIQMRRAMREAGDPGITGFAGQPDAVDPEFRRQVEGADYNELFRMAQERGINTFGTPNDEIRRLLLASQNKPNPQAGGEPPVGPVQNPLTPQAGGGSGGALPPVEPPVLPPDETPDLPPQRPENSVSDMASAARQIAIDEDQYRSALRTEIMRNGFPRPTEAELDEVIKDNPWKNPILEDSYIEALGKVKSQREYTQRVREYDQLLEAGEITEAQYNAIFDRFSEMRADLPFYDDFNHMMEDVPGEIAEQTREIIEGVTGKRVYDDGSIHELDLDGTPEEQRMYREQVQALLERYGVSPTPDELNRFVREYPFIQPAEESRTLIKEGQRVAEEATEGAFDFGTNGVSEETLDALIDKAKRLSEGALGGRRNSAASKSVGTRIIGVLMEARKVSKSDDPVVRGAKFAQHMADNLTESQINSLRQIGFPADQIRLIQMYKAVPMENVDPVRQAAAQIKDIGDEMDSGIAEFRNQLDHGEPPVVDVKGMAGKVESPIPIRKDAPEGVADSVKRERTRLEGVFRGMVEETANIADPVQKGKAKLDYLRENLTDRELEHARFIGIITDQEHASIANATRKAFTDAEINDQNPVELFPAEKVSPEERAGFQSRLEAETAERNRVQAERQAQGQPTPNEEATRGFRAERQRIQEAVNSGEMSIDEANRRLTAIEASEKANREQPVEKQPLRSFKLSAEENSSPFKGSDLEDFLADVPETGNPEFDSRIARMREIAAMDKLDDEGALKEEFRQLWTEIRKHPDAPPGFRGEYTLADPRPGTGKAGRPASNHYESPPADVQAERRRVEKAYRFAEIKQDEYKARMAELRAMSSGSSGQTPPVGNVQVPPSVPPPIAAGGGGSVPPVSPPGGGGMGGGGNIPPNVPPPNPAGGFGNMPYGPGGQGRFGTAVNPIGFRTKLHAALVKAPTDAAFKWWVNHREAAQSFGSLIGNKFKKFDNVSFTQYQQNPQAYPEVHDYFADWHRDLTNAGVKMGQKDSYLPQLWENPQAVAQLPQTQQNRLLLKPGFTFNAMVQNYEEGIKQGLIPKFKTISELGNFYETSARKALADRQFFEYLKQNRLIKPRGAKGTGGWESLNLDFFPTATLGKKPTTWVISPQFSAGKTLVKGRPRVGKEAIENYLSKDNPIYTKIANVASNLKNLRLVGGVPFTGLNAHGKNTFVRWLSSSDKRVSDFATGAGYLINPRSARKKLESYGAALPDARAHGLTVTGEEFDADKFLRPGSPKGVLERTNHALDKVFADPLFRNIIPAMKMQRYEALASQYIQPGMNAQQMAAAKNKAAQEVNALFGGINWKELGESQHTQNLLRTFALAPDWMRTNVQGGKRLYNAILDPNSKESKMYLRMGANLLAGYVAATTLNKTMSGKWSHENDAGHEFDVVVGKDSKGKNIYIQPFGTAADFIRLPLQATKALFVDKDPGQIPQMARNRTSIPVGQGLDWYGGDFRGEKLLSDRYGKKKDYSEILKGLVDDASDLLPNPVEAPIDWMRGSTSGMEAVSRALEAPLGFAMPKDGQGKGRKRIQRRSIR